MILIVMFSLTTPTGIILGMMLSGISTLLRAIFLSVSAGTFLYISASDVIVEEFSISLHKLEKFLSFIIGAGIIILFTIYEYWN